MNTFKIIAAAAAALIVIGLAGKIYTSGRRDVLNAVEKQNAKAANDADLAALSLNDCNAARARGCSVFYDFDAGQCRRRQEDGNARPAGDCPGQDGR